MPIYEYRCNNCNLEFELLIFSYEEAVCPKCGAKNLTKKVSLVSFMSEGSFSEDNTSKFSSGFSSCTSCSSRNCSSCK